MVIGHEPRRKNGTLCRFNSSTVYIYTQMNHQVSNIEIKVVKGTILPEENELGSEYSLFYWANFVLHIAWYIL